MGLWDKFTSFFCKAEFLCYAGNPNWAGWLCMIMIIGYMGNLYTAAWRVGVECSNCGHRRPQYHVCPSCGHYDGGYDGGH